MMRWPAAIKAANRRMLQGRISAIAVCLLYLPGCVPPVVSLAGLALDAINGGGPSSSMSVPSGPFAGAPTEIQSRAQGDPAISEALAQAEQRTVTDECTAKLPPAAPSGSMACGVRPVCLPGSRAPIRLRVCPRNPDTLDRSVPESVSSRPPGWKWVVTDQAGGSP
jgi:hypothetical protein